MQNKLEIIGFTIEGCIIAQSAGADRIELCSSPAEGGTTPSYGIIKAAREKLSIELFPIIRPRGGDFIYTEEEFNVMVSEVKLCKQLNCDGIVIGILNADGSIDKERCSKLIEQAYPLSITFHRAFDRVKDPFEALEDIISIGCERILTSGRKQSVENGISLITELMNKAADRIIIMPGSGLTAENIATVAKQTGATEFHSSARKFVKGEMQYFNEHLSETNEVITVDEAQVKSMKQILNSL